MNLELRHDMKGVWGYHPVSDVCWCFDDDVLARAFRELRKDKDAVLWIMDVSDIGGNNLANLSMSWDTWEDYDAKIITMSIWKNWNDMQYRRVPWEKGKRLFKQVVEKAKRGDVVVEDVFKPEKVY